jgi:hypothetical protein
MQLNIRLELLKLKKELVGASRKRINSKKLEGEILIKNLPFQKDHYKQSEAYFLIIT